MRGMQLSLLPLALCCLLLSGVDNDVHVDDDEQDQSRFSSLGCTSYNIGIASNFPNTCDDVNDDTKACWHMTNTPIKIAGNLSAIKLGLYLNMKLPKHSKLTN
jgi:hypothetical protein